MENNQSIIEKLISWDENISFETKRVSGKMVRKALETIVAFANTEGGFLVLGIEDFKGKRNRSSHRHP
ncbi:MAG: AlbA family DNA-binding domain-containing protein [Candidatus Loosdrechtia sp.]|uniref:AlbA family DNA-binding domain-containing protein n=1 Tax=Candidatus Loosdrechtia sp. TaxID=3101272 RepID=UPI003A6265F7|nr:MAG: ATP-binding protein [Candidatus Jettenia sp. AMX2]